MKHRTLFYATCLGLSTIFSVSAGNIWPETQAEIAHRSKENLSWSMDDTQCMLTAKCDIPKQRSMYIRKLDVAAIAGKTAILSYEYKMNVNPGEKSYWGVKAFFQFTGADRIYCGPSEFTGEKDWTPVIKKVTFPQNISSALFFVGIEGAVGTASFRNVKLEIQ